MALYQKESQFDACVFVYFFFFVFALKDDLVIHGTWQMVLIFKWPGRRILQNMYRLPHSMLWSPDILL